MKLLDLLSPQCIIDDLQSDSKSGVLKELAQVIVHANNKLEKNELVSILNEREKIGSTGIGHGVAIPHGKYAGLSSLIAAFGLSRKGIDFNALDGQKVHHFCLLIAPEDSVGDHLKALARISRLFKKAELRENLLKAQSKQEIWDILAEADTAI